MARITIEDCIEKVPNRFQLVRMASIRAKQLKKGARPLLSTDENKEVVTSLREIAAGVVTRGEAAPPPEPPIAEAPAEAAPAEAAAADGETEAAAEETPEG